MKKLRNIISNIKPVETAIIITVLILVCTVVLPTFAVCVDNSVKSKCSEHITRMINKLTDELEKEETTGARYLHDIIENGNYRKMLNVINSKTGGGKDFPSSDYYVRTEGDSIKIMCSEHKTIKDKSVNFSVMKNISVNTAQKPFIEDKILYLTVSGQNSYTVNDPFDVLQPLKRVFDKWEIDSAQTDITVTAVYPFGRREELPRGRYTLSAEKLDMRKSGEVKLFVTVNSRSPWYTGAQTSFNITINEKVSDPTPTMSADITPTPAGL